MPALLAYNGNGGTGLANPPIGVPVSAGSGNSFSINSTWTFDLTGAVVPPQAGGIGVITSNNPYKFNYTVGSWGSTLLNYPEGVYFFVFTNHRPLGGKNITMTITRNITVSYSGRNIGALCDNGNLVSFC